MMWFSGDPMPGWLPGWLRYVPYAVVPLSDNGNGKHRYLIASDEGHLWAISQQGDDYAGATSMALLWPTADDGARGDATQLMAAIKYAMRKDLA